MKYNAELFAQFVYSEELTYDELLDAEKNLISFTDETMQKNKAEHIHFEPLGDALCMQCSFAMFKEELFETICDELAPIMDTSMEARLLFVDKELESVILYSISKKKWKKKLFPLPPAGSIGKSLLKGGTTK